MKMSYQCTNDSFFPSNFRGRTPSKDSQQSSQSDLSLSGGGVGVGGGSLGSATSPLSKTKTCGNSRKSYCLQFETLFAYIPALIFYTYNEFCLRYRFSSPSRNLIN